MTNVLIIKMGYSETLDSEIGKVSSLGGKLKIFKDSINNLWELFQKRKVIKKKRNIFKWLILIFVFLYFFALIISGFI